ncbi:WhiB family transcriptional regulator [Streptomyces sp. NBC_01216]|uniref:WhiB family transcriptional regulator n=1 Tax=Streptomyces sp. NBC_01216 TaxID=2903778 RepID=UPI002E0E3C64|nr:WhiB family transcriptional regulator [Streptomyces sp. NBC_01216]
MSDTRGISTDNTPDWRTQADCQRPGTDPEWWFPKGTTGPYLDQADDAKAFCRECPVALTCAQWAIRERISDGIYGGLTEGQRLTIARKGDLTGEQITKFVQAAWTRDTRDPLVDTYLRRTIQGDDGHVWWTRAVTSVSVAGRCYTPAQIAFELKHRRRPEGHVKAFCGQPYCVAAEHLGDNLTRWQRDHQQAA